VAVSSSFSHFEVQSKQGDFKFGAHTMIDNILARLFASELLMFVLVMSLMLAFCEVGFRIGLRLYATKDTPRKGQIAGIQGAVLGLLSLLLAFTFAMAVDRYDTRRGLVLKEANAIGTTYLRASLLPDTHQAPVRDLLRHYVDTRLTYWPLVDDPAKRSEGMRLIRDIQTQLWKHATESAREAPTDITATFIESLNQTIDTDAERIAAMRAEIPSGVWLLLVMVAASGCITSSYGSGAEGARSKLGSVLLPLLITVVIVLILDISHSRVGLIQINQQPLVDLQQSIVN
jgi:hypothetical protein